MDGIDDVEEESLEQEGALELVEVEVEHNLEYEALVVETLPMGTTPSLAAIMLNNSPWTL